MPPALPGPTGRVPGRAPVLEPSITAALQPDARAMSAPLMSLVLHLHGVPRVALPSGADPARGHAAGRTPEWLLERRAAALCALAALEPGFPRERAARWLWPDSTDPRRNLRQQALRFKQQFGRALLEEGGERLALAPGVVLVRPADPLEHAETARTDTAAGGPALHAADFGLTLLPDLSDDDGSEFAGWLAARREGERRARIDTLHAGIARHEATGELDAALALAARLVALDPAREASAQLALRLHYLRGDAAAGLAVFDALTAALAARHGAAPLPATLELAAALRGASTAMPVTPAGGPPTSPGPARPSAPGATSPWLSAPVTQPANLPVMHPVTRPVTLPLTVPLTQPLTLPVTLQRPPVLVGRGAELAAIAQAWVEARAVWLEGEAGLGKSRLIAELLREAGAASASPASLASLAASTASTISSPSTASLASPAPRALAGAGRPGDGGAPYTTLARWLTPLLADDGAAGLDAAARAALGSLAPGPSTAPSTAPSTVPPATTAAPLRPGELARAVTVLLDRHAVGLAVVDDLHFADAATLELLASLVAATAHDAAAPARRWLFATRPAEMPPAAQSLRDALLELHRLVPVALAPLDADAAGTLVATLGIAALDSLGAGTLGPALVRHGGGNPLFMLETLKQGLLEGRLAAMAQAGAGPGFGTGAALPRPGTVGALITRRLERLSEPAAALARVAAIAGVDFSVELAEAVLGRGAAQVAGAWAELERAQVLRGEAFAHDLVADAALADVPPVVARRLHALCAEWLEARGAEPLRLARHWHEGGVPARAAVAFSAAAERAQRASRPADEAALRTQAAAAYEAAGLHAERFEALALRITALVNADAGAQALVEARALASGARHDGERLRALHVLADLHGERGEAEAAIDCGREALALAERLGEHHLRVRVACPLASALSRIGRADEALALLAPLRGIALAAEDPEVTMLWHGQWAPTLGLLGRVHEAVTAFDDAIAAARRTGRDNAVGRQLQNCGIALRQGGQLDRALAMTREGAALLAAGGDGGADPSIVELIVARDETECGCYASALAALEALLPRFEAMGAAFWHQACRLVLATLWLHLGQPARAMPQLRDETAGLPAWLRADRRLWQLELGQALRQLAAASLHDEVLALAGQDLQRGPVLRARALRFAAADEVLAQADALAAPLRASERLGALALLHLLRARAALELDRPAEAAPAARALLALLDDGVAPESTYRAEAWWIAGRALAAAGDEAAAEAAFDRGTRWVTQHALPQVPAAFIDSFLHRNAVNRALLATAQRARAAMPALAASPTMRALPRA